MIDKVWTFLGSREMEVKERKKGRKKRMEEKGYRERCKEGQKRKEGRKEIRQ